MQRHDIPEPGEPGGPPGEERLTTENLAGRRAAVYPGESTGDSAEAREPPTASDASDTADLERENEPEAGKEDQPLLGPEEAERYRARWREIQSTFVDEPRDAVQSADVLVAEVMQTIAQSFSAHKQALKGQWGRGEHVATEDLRVALQRYPSFFNRLLST